MHGFSDASKDAYAAVIYIVGEVNGKFSSSFVSCKTKVAPLKKDNEKETSIPRLELCACLLLARLVQTVQNSLKDVLRIDRVVCWSDSLDALFWIKRQNKTREVFVENRKKKVVEIVPPECWRHMDGDKNPADLPSRGVYPSPRIEQVLKKFIKGPDVIRSPEEEWLPDKSSEEALMSKVSERWRPKVPRLRKSSANDASVNVVQADNEPNKEPGIVPSYSCLHVSQEVTKKGVTKKFQMRHPLEKIPRIDKVINIEDFSSIEASGRIFANP